MASVATRHAWTGAAVVLALGVAFITVVWQSGLLDFSGTAPSATVVAAAIALVGGFLGTVVTAIGLVLKHSLDERTERRLELEAARNAELKREAEDRLRVDEERNAELKRESEARLRLEAAIRAVELMSAAPGALDPSIQRAGALFTLASLGQHELTLSLALSLFDGEHIDANTFANVVDAMYATSTPDIQDRAMSSLVDRARHLVTVNGIALPQRIIDAPTSLNDYCRRWLPVLVARIIAVRHIDEWTQHKYQLYALMSTLCVAWEHEENPNIKDGLATALFRILKAYDGPPSMYHPVKRVDVMELKSCLEDGVHSGAEVIELVSLLDAWLERNAKPFVAANPKSESQAHETARPDA